MPSAAMSSRVHAASICASAAPTSTGARPSPRTWCSQLRAKSIIEPEPNVKWSVVRSGSSPASVSAASRFASRLLPDGGVHSSPGRDDERWCRMLCPLRRRRVGSSVARAPCSSESAAAVSTACARPCFDGRQGRADVEADADESCCMKRWYTPSSTAMRPKTRSELIPEPRALPAAISAAPADDASFLWSNPDPRRWGWWDVRSNNMHLVLSLTNRIIPW